MPIPYVSYSVCILIISCGKKERIEFKFSMKK